jgi:hypothetical protein
MTFQICQIRYQWTAIQLRRCGQKSFVRLSWRIAPAATSRCQHPRPTADSTLQLWWTAAARSVTAAAKRSTATAGIIATGSPTDAETVPCAAFPHPPDYYGQSQNVPIGHYQMRSVGRRRHPAMLQRRADSRNRRRRTRVLASAIAQWLGFPVSSPMRVPGQPALSLAASVALSPDSGPVRSCLPATAERQPD